MNSKIHRTYQQTLRMPSALRCPLGLVLASKHIHDRLHKLNRRGLLPVPVEIYYHQTVIEPGYQTTYFHLSHIDFVISQLPRYLCG